MNHSDHVALIRDGITPGGMWADLGSGGGAFTLALADLLGSDGRIISIDRDGDVLTQQRRAVSERFPDVKIVSRRADFTDAIDLPPLDGIVMANSLHFVRDKAPALRQIHGWLKPSGRLVLVEYNTDSGNTWVPHPLAFGTWQKLASEIGFRETRQIGAYPSRFLREIYSALSFK